MYFPPYGWLLGALQVGDHIKPNSLPIYAVHSWGEMCVRTGLWSHLLKIILSPFLLLLLLYLSTEQPSPGLWGWGGIGSNRLVQVYPNSESVLWDPASCRKKYPVSLYIECALCLVACRPYPSSVFKVKATWALK